MPNPNLVIPTTDSISNINADTQTVTFVAGNDVSYGVFDLRNKGTGTITLSTSGEGAAKIGSGYSYTGTRQVVIQAGSFLSITGGTCYNSAGGSITVYGRFQAGSAFQNDKSGTNGSYVVVEDGGIFEVLSGETRIRGCGNKCYIQVNAGGTFHQLAGTFVNWDDIIVSGTAEKAAVFTFEGSWFASGASKDKASITVGAYGQVTISGFTNGEGNGDNLAATLEILEHGTFTATNTLTNKSVRVSNNGGILVSGSLIAQEDFKNSGTLIVYSAGTLCAGGSLNSSGQFVATGGKTFTNSGTVEMYGAMYSTAVTNTGTMTVGDAEGPSATFQAASFNNSAATSVASFTNADVSITGAVTNAAGAGMTIQDSTFEATGKFTNSGTLLPVTDSTVTVGTSGNTTEIFYNTAGKTAALISTGASDSSLTVNGELKNSGTLTVATGSAPGGGAASITVNGRFTNTNTSADRAILAVDAGSSFSADSFVNSNGSFSFVYKQDAANISVGSFNNSGGIITIDITDYLDHIDETPVATISGFSFSSPSNKGTINFVDSDGASVSDIYYSFNANNEIVLGPRPVFVNAKWTDAGEIPETVTYKGQTYTIGTDALAFGKVQDAIDAAAAGSTIIFYTMAEDHDIEDFKFYKQGLVTIDKDLFFESNTLVKAVKLDALKIVSGSTAEFRTGLYSMEDFIENDGTLKIVNKTRFNGDLVKNANGTITLDKTSRFVAASIDAGVVEVRAGFVYNDLKWIERPYAAKIGDHVTINMVYPYIEGVSPSEQDGVVYETRRIEGRQYDVVVETIERGDEVYTEIEDGRYICYGTAKHHGGAIPTEAIWEKFSFYAVTEYGGLQLINDEFDLIKTDVPGTYKTAAIYVTKSDISGDTFKAKSQNQEGDEDHQVDVSKTNGSDTIVYGSFFDALNSTYIKGHTIGKAESGMVVRLQSGTYEEGDSAGSLGIGTNYNIIVEPDRWWDGEQWHYDDVSLTLGGTYDRPYSANLMTFYKLKDLTIDNWVTGRNSTAGNEEVSIINFVDIENLTITYRLKPQDGATVRILNSNVTSNRHFSVPGGTLIIENSYVKLVGQTGDGAVSTENNWGGSGTVIVRNSVFELKDADAQSLIVNLKVNAEFTISGTCTVNGIFENLAEAGGSDTYISFRDAILDENTNIQAGENIGAALRFEGYNVLDGSTVEQNGDKDMTIEVGSTLDMSGGASITVGGDVEVSNCGNINLDNASISAGSFRNEGSLTLTDGAEITLDGVFTNSENGILTAQLQSDGSLGIAMSDGTPVPIENTGTIYIDLSHCDMDGEITSEGIFINLQNLTGDGDVVVIGGGGEYQPDTGEGGHPARIKLSLPPTNTLYVNNEWRDDNIYKLGTNVGSFTYVGYNAFMDNPGAATEYNLTFPAGGDGKDKDTSKVIYYGGNSYAGLDLAAAADAPNQLTLTTVGSMSTATLTATFTVGAATAADISAGKARTVTVVVKNAKGKVVEKQNYSVAASAAPTTFTDVVFYSSSLSRSVFEGGGYTVSIIDSAAADPSAATVSDGWTVADLSGDRDTATLASLTVGSELKPQQTVMLSGATMALTAAENNGTLKVGTGESSILEVPVAPSGSIRDVKVVVKIGSSEEYHTVQAAAGESSVTVESKSFAPGQEYSVSLTDTKQYSAVNNTLSVDVVEGKARTINVVVRNADGVKYTFTNVEVNPKLVFALDGVTDDTVTVTIKPDGDTGDGTNYTAEKITKGSDKGKYTVVSGDFVINTTYDITVTEHTEKTTTARAVPSTSVSLDPRQALDNTSGTVTGAHAENFAVEVDANGDFILKYIGADPTTAQTISAYVQKTVGDGIVRFDYTFDVAAGKTTGSEVGRISTRLSSDGYYYVEASEPEITAVAKVNGISGAQVKAGDVTNNGTLVVASQQDVGQLNLTVESIPEARTARVKVMDGAFTVGTYDVEIDANSTSAIVVSSDLLAGKIYTTTVTDTLFQTVDPSVESGTAPKLTFELPEAAGSSIAVQVTNSNTGEIIGTYTATRVTDNESPADDVYTVVSGEFAAETRYTVTATVSEETVTRTVYSSAASGGSAPQLEVTVAAGAARTVTAVVKDSSGNIVGTFDVAVAKDQTEFSLVSSEFSGTGYTVSVAGENTYAAEVGNDSKAVAAPSRKSAKMILDVDRNDSASRWIEVVIGGQTYSLFVEKGASTAELVSENFSVGTEYSYAGDGAPPEGVGRVVTITDLYSTTLTPNGEGKLILNGLSSSDSIIRPDGDLNRTLSVKVRVDASSPTVYNISNDNIFIDEDGNTCALIGSGFDPDKEYTLEVSDNKTVVATAETLSVFDSTGTVTNNADKTITVTDATFNAGALVNNGTVTLRNSQLSVGRKICVYTTGTPGEDLEYHYQLDIEDLPAGGTSVCTLYATGAIASDTEITVYTITGASGVAVYRYVTGSGSEVPVGGTSVCSLTIAEAVPAAVITNSSDITMDIKSLITAGSIVNNGTITVDATLFNPVETDMKQVIDLDGPGDPDGTPLVLVLTNRSSDNIGIYYDAVGNDYWIIAADQSTVYVNSAWATDENGLAHETGDRIEDDSAPYAGKKLYYGYNAFSTFTDAYAETMRTRFCTINGDEFVPETIGTIEVYGTAEAIETAALNFRNKTTLSDLQITSSTSDATAVIPFANADGSILTLIPADDADKTITVNSNVTLKMNGTGYVYLGGDADTTTAGKVVINGGIDSEGAVVVYGLTGVVGGTLKAASLNVTAANKLTVSGVSTLVIGDLSGDNAIQLQSGTELVDSSVTGGSLHVAGAGALKFTGANELKSVALTAVTIDNTNGTLETQTDDATITIDAATNISADSISGGTIILSTDSVSPATVRTEDDTLVSVTGANEDLSGVTLTVGGNTVDSGTFKDGITIGDDTSTSYTLVKAARNIYLTTQTRETLYVNEAWKTAKFGDLVIYTDSESVVHTYVYGYNAFSSFVDALTVASDLTTHNENFAAGITIDVESDITEALPDGSGNLELGFKGTIAVNGTGKTVTLNGISDSRRLYLGTDDEDTAFVLDPNFVFNDRVYFQTNPKNLEGAVTINGTIQTGTTGRFQVGTASLIMNGAVIEGTGHVQLGAANMTVSAPVAANIIAFSGNATVGNGATLTTPNNGNIVFESGETSITGAGVEYSVTTPQVKTGSLELVDGVASISNTHVKLISHLLVTDDWDREATFSAAPVLNSTDATWTIGGEIRVGYYTEDIAASSTLNFTRSTINVTGAVNNVAYLMPGFTNVHSDAPAMTINLMDHTFLNAASISNAGTIKVTGSSLTTASVTNSGTIKTDVLSLITADSITGSGAITIEAGDFDPESGMTKVIALTTDDGGALVSKVNFTVDGAASSAYSLVYKKNGDGCDYYVTDSNQTTLYVNSAWTTNPSTSAAYNYGDYIETTAAGVRKYYGYNAASNIAEFSETTQAAGQAAKYSMANEIVITAGSYDIASKTYFYSDNTTAGVRIRGAADGVNNNVTFNGGRFYLTSAVADPYADNVAGKTAPLFTLDSNLTLNVSMLNVGNAKDTSETTRTGGKARLNIDGTLKGCLYVSPYSTVTVDKSGNVTVLDDVNREEAWLQLRPDSILTINGKDGEGARTFGTNEYQFRQDALNFIDGGTVNLNDTKAYLEYIRMDSVGTDQPLTVRNDTLNVTDSTLVIGANDLTPGRAVSGMVFGKTSLADNTMAVTLTRSTLTSDTKAFNPLAGMTVDVNASSVSASSVNNTGTITVDASYLDTDGVTTLYGASGMTAATLVNNRDHSITLTGAMDKSDPENPAYYAATLTVGTTDEYDAFTGGTITNSGTISLDMHSLIRAGSIDNASGTITIDASGYSDAILNQQKIDSGLVFTVTSGEETTTYVTVIDVDSNAGLELGSNIVLTNAAAGICLLQRADGDICIGRVDQSTFYVNGSWNTNTKTGEEVSDGEFYGYNAFSALSGVPRDGDGKIIATELVIEDGTFASTSNTPTFEGVATTINGGNFSTSVCGGYLYQGDGFEDISIDEKTGTDTLSLTITGGNFTKAVFAGDRVNSGWSVVRRDDIETTIFGGVFSNSIGGGMALTYGEDNVDVILDGNVTLKIKGGTFNNPSNKGWIYGGCIASSKDVAANTTITGNVTVRIDTSELGDAVPGITVANLVVGSYGGGKIGGNTNLVLTGTGKNITATGEIWGGSSSDVLKSTYIDDSGNHEVTKNVSGARILTFTGFEGMLTSEANKIRAFSDVVVEKDSNATVANNLSYASIEGAKESVDLSDVVNWTFENGSSLHGDFENNFNGDTLNLKGFTAATVDSVTLMTGDGLKSDDLQFNLLADIRMNGNSVGITPGACVIAGNTLTWSWSAGSNATTSESWLGGSLILNKATGTMTVTIA